MAKDVSPGQYLRTKTNQYVMVEKVDGEYIYVSYKGKTHKREKAIIGEKLFSIQTRAKKLPKESTKQLPKESKKTPSADMKMEVTPIKTCKNCMVMRRGDCFGEQNICEMFRYAPTVSEEETKKWPKYGDATLYRMKNKKK